MKEKMSRGRTGQTRLFCRAFLYKRLLTALLIAVLCVSAVPFASGDEGDEKWERTATYDLLERDTLRIDADGDMDIVYLYGCTVGTLYIGSGITEIILDRTEIGAYEADPENPLFTSVDGVLFSKDLKTLVLYPNARAEEHYDLPAGTKEIGEYAFSDAVGLTSVSFPMGLEKIGQCGFYRTGLTRVVLPPSVKEVGKFAFSDCVHLQEASVPSAAAVGERCFENCPLLDGAYSGDEAAVRTETPMEYYYYADDYVANPKNAEDFVYLYTAPDGKNVIEQEKYYCGEKIYNVEAYNSEWYRVDLGYHDWESEDGAVYIERYGYLKRSEAVRGPASTLFTVSRLYPKDDSVLIFDLESDDGGRNIRLNPITFGEYREAVKREYANIQTDYDAGEYSEEQYRFWIDDIGYCYCYYDDYGYADMTGYCYLKDTEIFREYTGDSRVLGMVMSDRPENRVNLRAAPDTASASLGKFFTGTQAEVLGEEGDWYHIRIGFTEGWMIKIYFRVIPQEDGSSVPMAPCF